MSRREREREHVGQCQLKVKDTNIRVSQSYIHISFTRRKRAIFGYKKASSVYRYKPFLAIQIVVTLALLLEIIETHQPPSFTICFYGNLK